MLSRTCWNSQSSQGRGRAALWEHFPQQVWENVSPRSLPEPSSTHSSWSCRGRGAAGPVPWRGQGQGRARAAAAAAAPGSASGPTPTSSLGTTATRSTASMRCTGKASSTRKDWISCWKRRVRAAGRHPTWGGTPALPSSGGVPRHGCSVETRRSQALCVTPSPVHGFFFPVGNPRPEEGSDVVAGEEADPAGDEGHAPQPPVLVLAEHTDPFSLLQLQLVRSVSRVRVESHAPGERGQRGGRAADQLLRAARCIPTWIRIWIQAVLWSACTSCLAGASSGEAIENHSHPPKHSSRLTYR